LITSILLTLLFFRGDYAATIFHHAAEREEMSLFSCFAAEPAAYFMMMALPTRARREVNMRAICLYAQNVARELRGASALAMNALIIVAALLPAPRHIYGKTNFSERAVYV